MVDLGRKRPEAGLVRHDLAGQRHAEHRASVKGARKCDHATSARVAARNLDGVLHGLCARGQENRLLFARTGRQPVQALGQLDIDIVGRDLETGVAESLELALDRGNDLGMIMPGIADCDAHAHVDVAVALDVPDFGIPRLVGKYRRLRADAHRRFIFPDCEQLFVACHY